MRKKIGAWALLLTLSATLLAVSAESNAARQPDLGKWFDRELTPFVVEHLTTHPRFKGELVRFIIFDDGNPASRSNALAIGMRNRLVDAVIDVPGVRVGWSNPVEDTRRNQAGRAFDCSKDAVHYYIGVEVSEVGDGQHKVDFRALDLEDRSWVAGFGLSWQGSLSRSESVAFRAHGVDQSFRGLRSVPFSDAEPDLVAAYLAHDLGCELLRQVNGEYRVLLKRDDEQPESLEGVVELVSNNLSGVQTVQVTADTDRANSILKGKAHHVDDDLYQYWVTIAPTDSSSELPVLSASTYIHLPGLNVEPTYQPPVPATLVSRIDADLLSSISIVELRNARACSPAQTRYRVNSQRVSGLQSWFNDCVALKVRTKTDAVVFFLNHQLDHGLVRLSGRMCSQRTEPRIARANEPLEYALPLQFLTHNSSSSETDWRANPDADVYYAIAVSDSKAARALSKQLEQLPRRCSVSANRGLEGMRLENWLVKFWATVDQFEPHVDWQAIRFRNVL